mmetsp:Transcript_36911/g.75285  ORF Transcript_36911/g.75285 Transcript_36911/m.75285 type:complete len:449 (-) Transcript_36911:415-1761(-)
MTLLPKALILLVLMRCGRAFAPPWTIGRFGARHASVAPTLDAASGGEHVDPDSPLGRNLARTCVLSFLTQRSIQSFMFLLSQCRDPHTVSWLEDFGDVRNFLQYHGTGAFNTTKFPRWDTFLSQMMDMPSDVVIVRVGEKNRQRRGQWKKDMMTAYPEEEVKNNPYIEEKFVEFEIDIDPTSLATRILSVREQLAREWAEDLDIVVAANEQMMQSYMESVMDVRDEDKSDFETGWGWSNDEEDGNDMGDLYSKSEIEGSGDDDYTAPYSQPKAASFDRVASTILNNKISLNDASSSPLRMGNFDLLFLLCTQESIHRILRNFREEGEAKEVSFAWLRDFYATRVTDYFDGNQRYGRADDFLEEMLLTPPAIIDLRDGKMGLIDPLRIAESIVQMRTQVAREWKEAVESVPADHTDLRRMLFEKQMLKWGHTPQQVEEQVEVIEGGDYE